MVGDDVDDVHADARQRGQHGAARHHASRGEEASVATSGGVLVVLVINYVLSDFLIVFEGNVLQGHAVDVRLFDAPEEVRGLAAPDGGVLRLYLLLRVRQQLQ